MENFMDRYETGISNNMGETCCDSLSIDAIATLADVSADELVRKMAQTKLVYGHITGSPQLKQGIASLYNDLGANVTCVSLPTVRSVPTFLRSTVLWILGTM